MCLVLLWNTEIRIAEETAIDEDKNRDKIDKVKPIQTRNYSKLYADACIYCNKMLANHIYIYVWNLIICINYWYYKKLS